jgi:hypothetical protein
LWLYPSSNLLVLMFTALSWWRRWRCCWWRRWRSCGLITFYVSIINTNNWIRCLRVRCATHWNIACRSSLIFCKLLRTNDRFVYDILYNTMIKYSSSTINRLFACWLFSFSLLVCFLIFLLKPNLSMAEHIFLHHD